VRGTSAILRREGEFRSRAASVGPVEALWASLYSPYSGAALARRILFASDYHGKGGGSTPLTLVAYSIPGLCRPDRAVPHMV